MLFELLNGNRWDKQKMFSMDLNDCYKFIKQFVTIYGCVDVTVFHKSYCTMVVIMGPVGMESGRFTMTNHDNAIDRLHEFVSW